MLRKKIAFYLITSAFATISLNSAPYDEKLDAPAQRKGSLYLQQDPYKKRATIKKTPRSKKETKPNSVIYDKPQAKDTVKKRTRPSAAKEKPAPEKNEKKKQSDKDINALLKRGYRYLNNGRYKDAKRIFSKVLDQRACDPDAMAGLEEIAAVWANDSSMARETVAIYKLLLRCKPNNPVYYFELGRVMAWIGKYDASIKLLNRSLAIDSGYSDAEKQLGLVYFWDNQLRKAEKIFKKYPTDPDIQLALAKVLIAKQEYAEAKQILEKVLEVDTTNVDAFNNLNFVNSVLQSQDQDKKIAEKKQVKKHLKEASRQIKEGDFEGAKSTLKSSVESDPKDLSASIALGYLYLKMGEIDQAKEAFEQVLESNKCNGDALNGLAEVAKVWKGDRNRFQEVIRIYETLITCRPKDADYLFALGQLYAWTGRLDKAENLLEKSLKLSPDYADAQIQLGLIYAWQKKYDQAIKILSQFPESYIAQLNLAKIYIVKGKYTYAIAILEELSDVYPTDRDVKKFLHIAKQKRRQKEYRSVK